MSARQRGGQPGEENGNWRGGLQEGVCLHCGNKFKAPCWELKHRMFCSRNCYAEYKLNPNTHRTRPYVHIVEKILGRRLPETAVIHHLNGNRRDNRPSNLVICNDQSHHLLLHARARIVNAGGNPNTDKICSRCKEVKNKADFHAAPAKNDGRRCYCKSCQSKIYQERRSRYVGVSYSINA